MPWLDRGFLLSDRKWLCSVGGVDPVVSVIVPAFGDDLPHTLEWPFFDESASSVVVVFMLVRAVVPRDAGVPALSRGSVMNGLNAGAAMSGGAKHVGLDDRTSQHGAVFQLVLL